MVASVNNTRGFYQAISTKYHGPGNVRGARVSAMCDAGKVTLSWDHSKNVEQNHSAAALALCEKLQWDVVLQGGGIKGSGFVFVIIKHNN